MGNDYQPNEDDKRLATIIVYVLAAVISLVAGAIGVILSHH